MRLLTIIGTLSLLLSSITVTAQNTVAEQAKMINKIKADTTYLCAESTVKDWDVAYENACVLLKREIEDWLVQYGASDVKGAIASCEEQILQIKTTRGPLYRAFVYVKKNKLFPFADKTKLMVVDMPEGKEASGESQSAMETPINIENNSSTPIDTTRVAKTNIEKVTTSSHELSDEEKLMLDVTSFTQIKEYISNQNAKGNLKSYGKYKTFLNQGTCYLFVYNEDGEIIAHLKSKDGVETDVRTARPTSLKTDYKGCGAIWFQLNK